MTLHLDKYDNTGLCGWIMILEYKRIITWDEYKVLKKYIKENKPFWSKISGRAYYWNRFKLKPRIEWLEKHIKLNSK